ncbi:MAG: efflux RND transporter periplasmic adaptor subunit [Pirellulales bacterium]
MPTPLFTPGAASGSDAWQELEDVLAGLGQLARSPLEPEQFYERTLAECVRALSAVGGAAWLRAPNGALRPVAHLNWPGAEIAANPDARRAHEALLSSAAEAGHVVTTEAGCLLAPVEIAAADSQADAAGTTVAIIEITPRSGASPATYRGYEQFLTAVSDLAAEYHAFHELSRLRRNDSYREELIRLASLVHRSVELKPTAYAVANEGRRVIGCDRLSVLAAVGRTSRLLATSGASHVERRGVAARRMEELAELTRPTAEPAWYADGQCDALPPIADALEAHAEESHARHVAVIPLVRPTREAEADGGESRGAQQEQPVFVLIAEQFDARAERFSSERLLEVAEVTGTALYNALDVDQLPLRWLLRPLAEAKRKIVTHMARSTAIAVAAATALAALVLIPADFTVDASGTLQPAVRREVFAPRSGLVDQVLVAPGADVAAGAPLVRLRDPSLELDLKRVRGEMETVRRQLEAARATKTNREMRDESPVELYRLSASEREFQQQLANLTAELKLLNGQRDELVVRSPIAGRVLTWDLSNRLAARPVERGEVLLTVADLSADWQLELDVADDRIGHVLAAQSLQENDALPVEFQLHSADSTYSGHVEKIGMTASVDTREPSAARPMVEVTVAFDKQELGDAQQDLRPGVTARAEIDCGRRPLGYVWFHDVWDAAINWLRF